MFYETHVQLVDGFRKTSALKGLEKNELEGDQRAHTLWKPKEVNNFLTYDMLHIRASMDRLIYSAVQLLKRDAKDVR